MNMICLSVLVRRDLTLAGSKLVYRSRQKLGCVQVFMGQFSAPGILYI
jgi:hypothetical protein